MYPELIKMIRKYDDGVPLNDEFVYPIDLFSNLLYELIKDRGN